MAQGELQISALTAELIRSHFTFAGANIHTATVAATLRSTIEPILLQTDNALLTDARHELDQLEKMGDLFSTTGGYWSPAPLRIVEAEPDSDLSIVVSGFDSPTLYSAYGIEATPIGRVRTTSVSTLPLELRKSEVFFRSWPSWVGLKEFDLEAWTAEFLDRCRASFGVGIIEGLEDCDVYTPQGTFGRGRGPRWTRFSDWSATSDLPCLCRAAISGQGHRSEYIVAGSDRLASKSRQIQSTRIELNDALRLRFGLDHLADCALPLRMECFTDCFVVKLHRPWPAPENRIFSLATRTDFQDNNAAYPKTYAFPNSLEPVFRSMANALKIELTEDYAGASS